MARGTEITLVLKEDAEKFCEEKTIKDIVKKHSQFVAFPINLMTIKTEEKVEFCKTKQALLHYDCQQNVK